MAVTPEISGASIVLIGHFNPLIFRPEWFLARDIVTSEDAEQAKIEILHADVSILSFPSMNISVQRERFSADISQEPLVRLNDFVVSCFTRLQDTPVRQLGINRLMHFSLASEAEWHRLGDTLAPKEPWGDLMLSRGGRRKGGLRSLTMEQTARDDKLPGLVRVIVQPSSKVKYGLFVEVNDHYELAEGDAPVDAINAAHLLSENWERSMKRAVRIAGQILRAE